MAIIYRAVFPNGKSYVGFTKNDLEKRKKEHEKTKQSRYFMVHKAIIKYGKQNVVWEVLEESENHDVLLKERERYFINKFQSHFTKNGYNMTYGGESGTISNWINNLTEEQRIDHFLKCSKNLIKANSVLNREHRLSGWKDNDERREQTRKRTKNLWNDKQFRTTVSKKISDSKKEAWKMGVYNKEQMSKMTVAAQNKIKGSKWFNDGSKNYRLFETDRLIIELLLIKGKI